MNNLARGVVFVALGASSYGMLATIVKMAYKEGYTTAEVTSSQFFLGIFCLFFMVLFTKKTPEKPSSSDIAKLMISGTTMGFTSVLYYLAVKYINASIAVVLLMQSVWIGVVIEAFQTKKMPGVRKISAVILVLTGTLLATNLLNTAITLDIRGLIFGFLAALSFSLTLYTTNSIATHLPAVKRSLFMLLGGGVIVGTFVFLTQIGPFYFGLPGLGNEFNTPTAFRTDIFYTWGIILSLFGTIIPPLLLNKGFPLTGVGLGSIVSSLELPISVTFAFILIDEKVIVWQWLGIFIILSAIVLMNYQLLKKSSSL